MIDESKEIKVNKNKTDKVSTTASTNSTAKKEVKKLEKV